MNTGNHSISQPILVCMLIFSALSFTISGCYYDVEEQLYPAEINPCDTTAVTFSTTIVPLMEQNCYTCHSADVNLGGVTVEGYDNIIVLVNNGSLEGSTNHQSGYSPMPQNAPKLTDCNLLKINKWISDGALNN